MPERPAAVGPYLFLSYASAERERAVEVADALEAAGIAVWLDRNAIAGGSSWSAEIVRGIQGAAAVAVLGSHAAYSSPNVQRELNLAVEENRPLLPLLLDAAPAPPEVRYALAGRQWIDLQREQSAWLPDLLRALARLGMLLAGSAAAQAPAVTAAAGSVSLPAPLTSLVGREEEIAAVCRLLGTARLVTLTGPGGAGKTRLAVAVAQQVSERFPGGVYFVDLSAVSDPAFVPAALGSTLAVRESEGRSLLEAIVATLRDKRVLLVLDNFEQVVAAAEIVRDLLIGCTNLTLLVTSRIVLRLPGEKEYAVPPLPVPREGGTPVAALHANPAVQLFVQRAQDARLDFTLTDENAANVAAICRRLDGLPLAIELAAARVKVLQPQALLARLDSALKLLTGGSSLLERQQTLRGAIQWSFDLLSPQEQKLFQRLAVFAGGCTLDSAETVCAGDGELDVLDGLTSLLEKSLLRRIDGSQGEPRFAFLATVHEFGWERLGLAGELRPLRQRHAEWALALAERTVIPNDIGPRSVVQLGDEQENLRAALGWALESDAVELGLRLVGVLAQYWFIGQQYDEGLHWAHTFLERPGAAAPSPARARALLAIVRCAWAQGKFPLARSAFAESLDMSRTLGDRNLLAEVLTLAAALEGLLGRTARRALGDEAIQVYRDLRDGTALAAALFAQAKALRDVDEIEAARQAMAEGLAIYRTFADEWSLALVDMGYGHIEVQAGNLDAARTWYHACLPVLRAHHDRFHVARVLARLGRIAQLQGERTAALDYYRESLTLYMELGSRNLAASSVVGIAATVADEQPEHAALLYGAAEAVIGSRIADLPPPAQTIDGATIAALRGRLGESAFASACHRGSALPLDDAVRLALASEGPIVHTGAATP